MGTACHKNAFNINYDMDNHDVSASVFMGQGFSSDDS